MDFGFAGTRTTRFVLVLLASLTAITLSSAALAAPDTDGDGMPDAWEANYGFNAYDPGDAALDTDTDGFSNVDEYRVGTDPIDVTSYPVQTTTWFESFENGIPADATTDASSDAVADQWIVVPFNICSTEGTSCLSSTDFDPPTGAEQSRTIAFTKYFSSGTLTADLRIELPPNYQPYNPVEGRVEVLIDGYPAAILTQKGSWLQAVVPVPQGVHTVAFKITAYPQDVLVRFGQFGGVVPMIIPRLNIDNIRFVGDVDTDGDGLSDKWEIEHGLNPEDPSDALADFDGDGLSNFDEYTAGSDISNADTDGDGLLDGDEVVLGSNVLNGDSDADGLPDGWEAENGLDPLNTADAWADSDGDGISNIDEYRVKTDPQDANSAPEKVRRWFESFENGVPADASSDSTSDASSDQWATMNQMSSDGAWSLVSPNFKTSDGWQSRTIAFTKYFEAGTMRVDLQLADYSYAASAEVLLDGYPVASLSSSLAYWRSIEVAVPEGVHTISFRVSGYPSYVFPPYVLPILLVDNIRFVVDGDSDGDGIPDRWELDHGLDPDDALDGAADNDNDGLSNAEEYVAGSDLNNADSDADGLGDADEVARGTSPLNADSDADGLPDAYEVAAGFDPLNGSDAAQDSDGDGVSNLDEFRFGTDPNDPASVPEVTSRWFESFEAGVPADWDASSDTSSDATSDEWTVTTEFATDGVQSLTAPVTPVYQWSYVARQISFTKLFTDGRLSLDLNLGDDTGFYYGGVDVLVDGFTWFVAYSPGTHAVAIDLPAGVHTVSIRYYTYGDSYYFPQRRLFVDNVRFISDGDTDGDGMSDRWEFDNGFDPDDATDGALDGDGDGLSNAEEFAAATNPNNADSDADGLNDGDEVEAGTNPLSGDSDNDGLSDAYEIANGLDPLDGSDAAADADGDGFTNGEEFRVGTDPRDAASVPALTTSLFESFENGVPADWDASTDASTDAANWPWQQSQDFATDGTSSLKSAPVPAGKRTETYINRYFAEGTLSFDFKVSTDGYYDILYVTVDGEQRVYAYNGNSGRRFLQLTQGVHEIRFAFARDYYFIYDEVAPRAAWIDNVRFEQGAIEQDSDSDGMPDAWEMANGTNWYNPWDGGYDYDGDGLNNQQEYFAGTNLYNADSDGDGLSDSEEVDVIGSDPLDTDSDDDGLPDAWEVANGLNPSDAADANLDSDGDGFSNAQEYLWGTAANDPGEPALQQTWFESFEAGFPADWDASGDASTDASTDASSDAPWQLTTKVHTDGIYGLRAGAINHLQNSAVSVAKFLQPGVLFFDYKISSYFTDTLSLYVNGEKKLAAKPSLLPGRAEIALEGGRQQLKFVFNKNSKLKLGDNTAYIDNIEFFAYGADGDLDGMEDLWERRNRLNPYDPTDALKDPDFDRVNNLQEYRNGTNPRVYNRPARTPKAANSLVGGGTTGGSDTDSSSSTLLFSDNGGGGAAGVVVLMALGGFAGRRFFGKGAIDIAA